MSNPGKDPVIGDRVRFPPNPRFPKQLVEADVIGTRRDPRCLGCGPPGWLDTRDDAGFERSVRPSRCEIIAKAESHQ